MNTQRIVAYLVGFFLILQVLIVPWNWSVSTRGFSGWPTVPFSGYAPVFTQPHPTAHIDFGRLLLQLAVTLGVGALLYVLAGKREEDQ
jgi:hypothetical protein